VVVVAKGGTTTTRVQAQAKTTAPPITPLLELPRTTLPLPTTPLLLVLRTTPLLLLLLVLRTTPFSPTTAQQTIQEPERITTTILKLP